MPVKPREKGTLKLTNKQKVFHDEYVNNGMNGAAAARAAKYKSPEVAASKLLNGRDFPLVKQLIDKTLSERHRVNEPPPKPEEIRTNEELMRQLHTVIFFEPLRFFDDSDGEGWLISKDKWKLLPKGIGCMIEMVKSVVREDDEGNRTEMFWVRLVSKTVAMSLVAKHQLPIPKQSLDVSVSSPDWDKLHQAMERVNGVEDA